MLNTKTEVWLEQFAMRATRSCPAQSSPLPTTPPGVYGIGGSVPLGEINGGALNANTGQITSTFGPRVIQFGLKVIY